MTQIDGIADHADKTADARERAVRTFLQGLGIDVLLAVVAAVYAATSGDVVAWQLLPLAVAKSGLTAAASYVMRTVRPPKVSG